MTFVGFLFDFEELWCRIFSNSDWCENQKVHESPVELPKPSSVVKPTVPELPTLPKRPESPKPPSVIELATELLTGNNPAGLHIKILPSATLKVGKAMKMRLRSDYDGHLIVLDINEEGILTTLFPNDYSDQQQGYLIVGKPLTFPDAYYGFEWRCCIKKQIKFTIEIISLSINFA